MRENKMEYLSVTRFNNETFKQYRDFHEKNKVPGCVYNVPRLIKSKGLRPNQVMYVLEMNNSENKIMGIGRIRNLMNDCRSKTYKIYDNYNYNRYTYIGQKRIKIEKLEDEDQRIIRDLEDYCFKGKGHLKRGDGIQLAPYKEWIKKGCILDNINYFKELFKKYD